MPQIRPIGISGSIPSVNELALGDIALNTYDGKAYIKKLVNNTQTIVELGTGGAGQSSISASYASTASFADFATTASYVLNAVSSSFALTSSYATTAVTASYALNGGVTRLLAGANIALSPTTGVGQVTISSTGGSGPSFNTATGSYGSFYDTTTQTNPVGNVPRSMSLNTTDITNGVSISGSTSPFNTYIKTQNAGIYDIQFSAQLDKTDSGTDEIVIWLRKNGTDLTDTATTITLNGNNDKQVAAWNWFVNSATDDYYQIIWLSADTDLRLLAEATSATHPGIPSVIVTVNRVDQFLSNTGSFSGSFNGSLFGTSSWAINAISSSYAKTGSYINPLFQPVFISGSTEITGSTVIKGDVTVNNAATIDFNATTLNINAPTFQVPSFALPYSPSANVRVVMYDAVSNALFVTASAPAGAVITNFIATGSVTASVQIGPDGAIPNFFLVQSGSAEMLKINTERVVVFESRTDTPTAVTGGFFYSASGEFFLGTL